MEEESTTAGLEGHVIHATSRHCFSPPTRRVWLPHARSSMPLGVHCHHTHVYAVCGGKQGRWWPIDRPSYLQHSHPPPIL